MIWWILLYGCAVLYSWYLIAGMFFAHENALFPDVVRKGYREALGNAIAVGLLYACFWPLGLPIAWLLTGFAEHGVWWREQ